MNAPHQPELPNEAALPASRPPIPDPPQPAPPPPASAADSYDFMASKVGFVPNVRRDDNRLQAKVFVGVWVLCIVVGALWDRGNGALLGALLGIVVALVISGAVLTIVGLKRP